MFDILTFFTFRTVMVMFSTVLSILLVMLVTNIITVDEVIAILDLSEESANALRRIIERIQEVSSNLLDILSQLLNKLFSWSGIDVDLSTIKVDIDGDDLDK